MSSRTFSKLINDLDLSLIPPHSFYSGHVRKIDGKREYLEDHSRLALDYFLYLVERNSLEDIIDSSVSYLFGEEALSDFKKILLLSIYYHDIGKINGNFQKKITGEHPLGDSTHSYYSKRILEILLSREFPHRCDIIYLITETVNRHHTRLKNYTTKQYDEAKKQRNIIKKICNDISCEFKEVKIETDVFEKLGDDDWTRLFLLLKLIYSLLVLSDAYSTFEFEQGLSQRYSINVLDEETVKKMQKSFEMVSYNQKLRKGAVKTINDIRREMLIEADERIEYLLEKTEHRIFMLPVPTGGGKTNISMKLALKILQKKNGLKRIFYVFPYINIVEQNYQVIEKTLFNSELFGNTIGLISDIYSKSYWDKASNDEEENGRSLHQMLIMDDNFLNNRVNIITTVNFFNSFIKTGGNNRYKLANLANSTVIIDEVQTLSDKNIRLFYDFIQEASKALNIYFILMSATLPNMNYFLDNMDVPSLIKNPQNYLNHPIFKRNQIVIKKEIETLEGIKELIHRELKESFDRDLKVLITLNTVATSRLMFEQISRTDEFKDFEIYLLNSTLSSPRRRKIIEEIRSSKKKEIIISTQSIEAGVDIDCDIGIRDFTIIDSIEQIAGRINREANMDKSEKSKLYLVHIKRSDRYESEMIYGGSSRYKITNQFNSYELESILNEKRFDEYYYNLAEEVKKPAKDIYDYIKREIMDLHYKEVNNSVDVIEEKIKKIDIFLCYEFIPKNEISEYDMEKIRNIFEDEQLKSLCLKYPVLIGNGVNTRNLFQVWKEVFSSTEKFEAIFLRRKVTSALNQFIISINNISKKDVDLENYLKKNGYLIKDEHFDITYSTSKSSEIYSFRNGLDVERVREALSKEIGVIL